MFTRLRRRVFHPSRLLRQQVLTTAALLELADHPLRPLVERAAARKVDLPALAEEFRGPLWHEDLSGELVSVIERLLKGNRLDRRAAANLFVAAIRGLAEVDLELVFKISSRILPKLPDPRAIRSLVTLHGRAGNVRRALGLLELLEPSDWTERRREQLERRLVAEGPARGVAGTLLAHVGYRSLLDDPAPAVLLYGDVDMNVIDGSSVWLASVAEALTGNGFEIHLLLKQTPERTLLLEPLTANPDVHLFEPAIFGVDRLQPEHAVTAIEALDGVYSYSAVILRGLRVCDAAASSKSLWGRVLAYLTDFYRIGECGAEVPPEVRDLFADLACSFDGFLVQTPQIARLMQEELGVAAERTMALPPLIPDHLLGADCQRADRAASSPLRIVCAGKIAPQWGVLELIEQAEALAAGGHAVEVHVVGDKIHANSDKYPTFREDALAALESPVVRWHKGLSRRECIEVMSRADVGWCYRDPHFERHTLELSTKLLEHMAIGLPPIVTRNEINTDLLGEDYPLFADGPDDLAGLLRRVAGREHQVDFGSPRYRGAVERHTIGRVRTELLGPALVRKKPPARRKRIVIAGHDLKFIGELESHLKKCGHIVRRDEWEWGRHADKMRSRYLARWADVVFCEWALANAAWYSQNLDASKRLIVRLHLQEIRRQARRFPPHIKIENVDGIVFVADDVKQVAARDFEWSDDKLVTIPNFVNTAAFARPKLPEARHTLAIVGIAPRRKRLDLALDLLAQLRQRDPAFRLIVKGVLPKDLPWLNVDPEERSYYDEQFERIQRDPLLKEAVAFEEFSPRLGGFYQRVGYVLSPSDFESFHYSVAEGAASGAIPLVQPKPPSSSLLASSGGARRPLGRNRRRGGRFRARWRSPGRPGGACGRTQAARSRRSRRGRAGDSVAASGHAPR